MSIDNIVKSEDWVELKEYVWDIINGLENDINKDNSDKIIARNLIAIRMAKEIVKNIFNDLEVITTKNVEYSKKVFR
jgi:3-methyladenine DNA glycosylase Tag